MLSAGEARQRSGLQPPPEACSLSHPLSLSVFLEAGTWKPKEMSKVGSYLEVIMPENSKHTYMYGI